MRIKGSNILVTGGAGSFGRAFSFDLASRGARIFSCDIDAEALAGIRDEAQSQGLGIETFQADISKENQVEGLFNKIVEQFGPLDVLINNAGVAEDGLLIKKENGGYRKFSFSQWKKGVDINLNGVFLCAREAAFHMIRQGSGGLIINISSVSRHGSFIQSNYSATKAAVVALSVVWAKELSGYGIRSVAIAPGYIDTPLTRKIPEKVRQKIVFEQIPQKRMGNVSEVAHAIRFAIENDYLNGRVIDLDGGLRI
ncbi:MAG: SDR family NAD(P)-dependent oxidoreductase [Deltaproteobacteria bacterium]|nr:SDR family NAD(P)-dependent oxidoreductase [Deltaproteobacteria bacterium]